MYSVYSKDVIFSYDLQGPDGVNLGAHVEIVEEGERPHLEARKGKVRTAKKPPKKTPEKLPTIPKTPKKTPTVPKTTQKKKLPTTPKKTLRRIQSVRRLLQLLLLKVLQLPKTHTRLLIPQQQLTSALISAAKTMKTLWLEELTNATSEILMTLKLQATPRPLVNSRSDFSAQRLFL